MTENEDNPSNPPQEKPLLITLIENNVFYYNYSLRYLRPRGFNDAEVWSPDRIDVSPGFSANPYLIGEDEVDEYNVKDPKGSWKFLVNTFKGFFKVGGYDRFPLNRPFFWRHAFKLYKGNIPWSSPSKYAEPKKAKIERFNP